MRYLCIYSTYEAGLYNENWLTEVASLPAAQTPVDITQTIIRSIMAKFVSIRSDIKCVGENDFPPGDIYYNSYLSHVDKLAGGGSLS